MVDVETIRENYARMPDFKLLQIAEEAEQLTHEAFIILKKEIKKRGLEATVIQEKQAERIENKKEEIRANLYKSARDFRNKIWTLALESKQQGLPDATIQSLLIKENVMPEDAMAIVEDLPDVTQYLLKEATDTIAAENIWKVCLLVLLLAVICAGLNMWMIYVVIAVRFISSIVRSSRASSDKQKLEEISEVIFKEKELREWGLK